QLFGLLSNGNATATSGGGGTIAGSDPQVLKKLATLEEKMAEQTAALERLFADRSNIEKELAAARAAGGAIAAETKSAAPVSSGGPNSADAATIKSLQTKIDELEGKLAEYSVIEDDLANLKKLQQENLALKAQMGGKSPTAETPAVESALVTAAASAATSISGSAALAATPPAAPAASSPSSEPTPQFENLVDQVEQSLKPGATPTVAPASIEATAAAPAPAPKVPEPTLVSVEAVPSPSASTTPAAGGSIETSDADLVAEFEKMLNG
ncbi:MAG: hypothetical protein AABZ55_04320, partial [Bdellovibrionota bacterium]